MQIHTLGFPRIGKKRELKFSLEKYWREEISKEEFLNQCQQRRKDNWLTQQQAGIDILPVGDFAHYDHILTTTLLLGLTPQRFHQEQANAQPELDLEFRIARGRAPTGCQCAASDMTKWFNTNYHYIVPELSQALLTQSEGEVYTQALMAQINECEQLNADQKVVLIGPLTYLYLSDVNDADKLSLLPALCQRYQKVINQLSEKGVNWLQIDEPILATELNAKWQQAFSFAYETLSFATCKTLLTTYFGAIDHQLELIKTLPFNGIHIDTVAEKTDVKNIINTLPQDWVISLGVINGRNIWKSDLVSIYQQIQPIYRQIKQRLWLAPSCSLLHSPVDLEQEQKLSSELKSWLAFAVQKCHELALLKAALLSEDSKEITLYSAPALARTVNKNIHNIEVQQRIAQITEQSCQRSEPFEVRKIRQQSALNLPLFPTTTIGSFPQTSDIRQVRAQWRRNEISDAQYRQVIEVEIKKTIEQQEAIGLDVFVHGEAERNDMVEYFGEQLNGVAFSQYAWVQSYGSRCVKPPIIFGDISRKSTMTVTWTSYAQSLTTKPVKAMLTGPVTILAWSFVRDDLPKEQVAKQIALAISDEVEDLVASGSQIIQIDEPAIREGIPIKQSQWQRYLDWATAAFRLSAAKASADIQIHSHMCYSEFNDILPAIIALDADVLTIESSRSNMAILDAFDDLAYPNDLGPGVYDIHSPNVPDVEEIVTLLEKAQSYIPPTRLWVNPDCGLKTRQWPETISALKNMVSAAQVIRQDLSSQVA